MENKTSNAVSGEKPKYNPLLMTATNFIILGVAYMVLRMYKRFFIVYALIIISILTQFYIIINFVTLFVFIDVFIQSRNVNKGKYVLKERKLLLDILGIVTVGITIILLIFLY